jgi:hypothetical protein
MNTNAANSNGRKKALGGSSSSYPAYPYAKQLYSKSTDQIAAELQELSNTTAMETEAMKTDYAQQIKTLEWKLQKLDKDWREYKEATAKEMQVSVVKGQDEQDVLLQQIAGLLTQLEEEKKVVVQETDKNVELQGQRAVLQADLEALQQTFSKTVNDLEDAYELEQNARAKEQTQHVETVEQIQDEQRAAVQAAVVAGLQQTETVRANLTSQLTDTMEELNLAQLSLATTRDTLRSREDLISEWSADRSSVRAMARLTWQLVQGRVKARAGRLKDKVQAWAHDVKPRKGP